MRIYYLVFALLLLFLVPVSGESGGLAGWEVRKVEHRDPESGPPRQPRSSVG